MPKKKPETLPLSARLPKSLLDEVRDLIRGTGITITHTFEVALTDYLDGPKAKAIREMKSVQ